MDKETKRFWTNQKTGEIECRHAPDTDEDAILYISQEPAAQNMYVCYRELGLPITEAMINVLSASIGESAPFPV